MAQTADEFFGAPTADEFFGPAPAADIGVSLSDMGLPLADEPQKATAAMPAQDHAVNESAIGRILDAVGQGAKDGWGVGPLGLSPDSEKSLREWGVFDDYKNGLDGSFKAVNEAFIRPAVAGAQALLRGGSSVIRAVQGGAGQLAFETGLAETSGRAARDIGMLSETILMLAGAAPASAAPRVIKPPTGEKLNKIGMAVEKDAPKQAAPFVESATGMKASDQFVKGEAVKPELAGNINLSRIDAGEDIKELIRQEARTMDDFSYERRGVVTWEETKLNAAAMGLPEDAIINRKIGQIWNDHESLSARQAFVQAAVEHRAAVEKARLSGADPDRLEVLRTATRITAMQASVAGNTAELGRALQAQKIMATASQEAEALAGVIKQLGGRDSIDDIIKATSELDTPAAINKYLHEIRQPSMADKVKEVFVNNFLWGPITHVTNIASNTGNILGSFLNTGVAATIGKVRAAMGSTSERVYFREMNAHLQGLVRGVPEGLASGWQVFKTEVPDALTRGKSAIEMEAGAKGSQAIGGSAGKVVRLPGRALQAEDTVFRTIAYRQGINQQAVRVAYDEGLTGAEATMRIASLVNAPTAKMMDKAIASADYQTFQQELGKFGKLLQQAANIDGVSGVAVKGIIPFVRTPLNIVKGAFDWSVLGPLLPEVRANLSGANGAAARDLQIGRMLIGTSIQAAVYGMAQSDMITGAGLDAPNVVEMSRKNALKRVADGWQPYSMKIGDSYYSYRWAGPVGILMGVIADAKDVSSVWTEAEASKIAALVTLSVTQNVVNQTWMQGLSNLTRAMIDPVRYGDKWVQRQVAGMLVPNVLGQTARVDDPYLRDAQTLLDAIRARIPTQSVNVLPARDVWGRAIAREGSAGPDLLSPIYESSVKNDAAAQLLLKAQIWPGKPEKDIDGVQLSPKQYDEWQQIVGQSLKYQLDTVAAIPAFANLPPPVLRERLLDVMARARKQAKVEMLFRHMEIASFARQLEVEFRTGNDFVKKRRAMPAATD